MTYNTNLLTTTDDCDEVLALANKEKGDLSYEKVTLERRRSATAERATKVADELTATQAELNAINTVIANLPDGDTKDDNILKQKRLDARLFGLQEQSEKYNIPALLDMEMKIGFLEKQLLEVEVFITAVETRKGEL